MTIVTNSILPSTPKKKSRCCGYCLVCCSTIRAQYVGRRWERQLLSLLQTQTWISATRVSRAIAMTTATSAMVTARWMPVHQWEMPRATVRPTNQQLSLQPLICRITYYGTCSQTTPLYQTERSKMIVHTVGAGTAAATVVAANTAAYNSELTAVEIAKLSCFM